MGTGRKGSILPAVFIKLFDMPFAKAVSRDELL
jgi:hypothetical protein